MMAHTNGRGHPDNSPASGPQSQSQNQAQRLHGSDAGAPSMSHATQTRCNLYGVCSVKAFTPEGMQKMEIVPLRVTSAGGCKAS